MIEANQSTDELPTDLNEPQKVFELTQQSPCKILKAYRGLESQTREAHGYRRLRIFGDDQGAAGEYAEVLGEKEGRGRPACASDDLQFRHEPEGPAPV